MNKLSPVYDRFCKNNNAPGGLRDVSFACFGIATAIFPAEVFDV